MEIFDLGDFPLQCGLTLPSAKLAYKTHGTLSPARDNLILFPNILGGVPEVLEIWIGEGRPIDPNKYFIVLPGQFGNGVSSSPSNTPAPFDRGAFPPIHIADDVIAQHKLLTEHFDVQEVQLVFGWSVGALQSYEWAVRFPSMIKRLSSIAGAPRPSPWTRLWLRTVLEEPITSDPNFNGGFYEEGAVQGGVRRMGSATALTLPPPGFYREGEETWKRLGFSSLDDFVTRMWQAFWLPQDPNDLLTQIRKTIAADPSSGGDLIAALGKITAKTLIAGFQGDPMFPPAECKRDAERIKGAQFKGFDSEFGHLATFALSDQDRESIDGVLREILAS